jgi:hypothetical protein
MDRPEERAGPLLCPMCGERWVDVRQGLGRHEGPALTGGPPYGRQSAPPVDPIRRCRSCDRAVELALWTTIFRPGRPA